MLSKAKKKYSYEKKLKEKYDFGRKPWENGADSQATHTTATKTWKNKFNSSKAAHNIALAADESEDERTVHNVTLVFLLDTGDTLSITQAKRYLIPL